MTTEPEPRLSPIARAHLAQARAELAAARERTAEPDTTEETHVTETNDAEETL